MKKSAEKQNGKKFLKIIWHVWFTLYLSYKSAMKVSKNKDKKSGKYKKYYLLMCRWISLQKNLPLLKIYMEKKKYHRFAIYGTGEMGKIIYDQLIELGYEVSYFIDHYTFSDIQDDIKIYRPGEILPKVDVIIVTPYLEYEKIKNDLCTENKMITIEEVIDGALQGKNCNSSS